jgi:Predicted ATPase
MLKEIHFENYRCFKKSILTFKELTIIVGKNNAGKSTVIEALRMISNANLRAKTTKYVAPPKELDIGASNYGFRINPEKLKIDLRSIVYFYENKIAKITAIFHDDSKIIIYANEAIAFACIYNKEGDIINSKTKAKESIFNHISILPQIGLIKENEKILAKETVASEKDTYLSSRHFRNELLLYRNEYYDDFCKLAETTWTGLRIRELDFEETNDEYINFTVEDECFPSEIGLMGSGMQMWLQIVWFVCRSKNCETIIFDEPDVYMHPDLQRKLINFIKKRFKQVIIATHSVEIISEVDPQYIVTIDKKNKHMNYATNKKGVQQIIENIGSVHNLALVRIANTKKCLFVEGKDINILSKFYSKIYPEKDYSIKTLPVISLGGWSRLDEAFGASKLFHEETEDTVKCYCIVDHDYYLQETIDSVMKKSEDSHLFLHIWKKKEIENYLINPSVIFRISRLPENEYDTFIKQFETIVDDFKTEVTDNIAEQIKNIEKSKSIKTCNLEAREIVEAKWTNLENKIDLVNGKSLLNKINSWMKTQYNKSCSRDKILAHIKPEEIDKEIKEVLEVLIN